MQSDVVGGPWQKGKLAEAAAKSEADMASWNREGDAPWKKGDSDQQSDQGAVQGKASPI